MPEKRRACFSALALRSEGSSDTGELLRNWLIAPSRSAFKAREICLLPRNRISLALIMSFDESICTENEEITKFSVPHA